MISDVCQEVGIIWRREQFSGASQEKVTGRKS